MADTIEVEVGDEIVLLTQSADGSMGNDLYTLVGLVTTGSMAIDRYGGYLHLEDLQALLVLEDSLHRNESLPLLFEKQRDSCARADASARPAPKQSAHC